MCHLPDAHTRFNLLQIRTYHALSIAKQQAIEYQISIQQGDIARIEIRPVIDFLHILRHILAADGFGFCG